MNLKNYTVVATGKIRPCAYEKLKNMVKGIFVGRRPRGMVGTSADTVPDLRRI